MTQDDFEEVNESGLPDELADAILAKITTHPASFAPIRADMVTDEMAIDYFKDYPYMKFEPDSLICAKRCIAAAVNAYMGAKK